MQRDRYASAVAATIAALFTAVTIRYASFAATISDGSGYVSEASRWLRGDLIGPQPFALLPAWPVAATLPFGYTLGLVSGTDVFTYPPGLPMTMAAAMAGGGELAAYLVPPVLGGALVWATGDLAARLAGARARVMGAALMATSAIALAMAEEPMTDVPAAAWWALSLVLALRGRAFAAFAAGLVVAMAILTRPNLTPLVVVSAALAYRSAPANRLLRVGLLTSTSGIGLGVLMYMQYVLYGSPWTTGHPGIHHEFALANIRGNAWEYILWYTETHTPVVALAALAPIVFWRGAHERGAPVTGVPARYLALALLTVVIAVYAAYLAYIPAATWGFLRFVLPALAPLYAVTAAVVSRAIDHAPRVMQLPVLVMVLVLTAGMQIRQAHAKDVSSAVKEAGRVPLAGHYLDAALPANAIVVTAFHSGSVRHYTGRPILRPDLVAPELLDATLARLARGGYKPYLLVDEGLERTALLARFSQSRFGTLDWPPRAQISGERGRIHLYDLADRERHQRGEQWPIDIVQWHPYRLTDLVNELVRWFAKLRDDAEGGELLRRLIAGRRLHAQHVAANREVGHRHLYAGGVVGER